MTRRNLLQMIRSNKSDLADVEDNLEKLRLRLNQIDSKEDLQEQVDFLREQLKKLHTTILPGIRNSIDRNRTLIWGTGITSLCTLLAILIRLFV
jgi:hypothetical protein